MTTSVRVAPGVHCLDDGSALAQVQPGYPKLFKLDGRTDEDEYQSPPFSRSEGGGQK